MAVCVSLCVCAHACVLLCYCIPFYTSAFHFSLFTFHFSTYVQSETYVLKQQGHLYGISTLDFSSDGQYIATGGDDSKVKLWNASSGFCFVTFSEHVAPITGKRREDRISQ